MQRILIILLALSTAVLLAAQFAQQSAAFEGGEEEDEIEIALDAVPGRVIDAALAAVEGIELTEAEVEAVLVYELEGVVDGQEFEIEITEEGDVIEVEAQNNGDDEDDEGEPSSGQ